MTESALKPIHTPKNVRVEPTPMGRWTQGLQMML